MSQQNPQKPSRQPQQRPPTYPAPPPTPQSTSLPPQPQVTQVERVIIQQRGRNPAMQALKALLWPFARVFAALRWLIMEIIRAMLRSIIHLIVTVLLLLVVLALMGVFGIALLDSDFVVAEAFALGMERIRVFLGGWLN